MLLIRKDIRDRGLDANIICQVHDALVVDVSIKDADAVADIIYKQFTNLPSTLTRYFGYNWYVPMTGEISAGINYKDQSLLIGKKGRVAYATDLYRQE